MSAIPSVEESLADPTQPEVGRSSKMKNLQYIIGGVVIVLVFVGVLLSAKNQEQAQTGEKQEKERVARLNQANISTPVHPDDIEKSIDAQKRAAVAAGAGEGGQGGLPGSLAGTTSSPKPYGQVAGAPQAADATRPLPPVPIGGANGTPYPGITPAEPNAGDVQRRQVEESARRDEQIRSAQILAITESLGAASKSKTAVTGPEASQRAIMVGGGGGQTGADPQLVAMNQQLEAAKARQVSLQNAASNRGGYGASAGYDSQASGSQPAGAGGESNAKWLEGMNRASPRQVLQAEPPGAQYVVSQGTIIPAVLITEINSDMPGQFTAAVSMDVYDSIHGEKLLIPKGSKLLGTYNSDIRPGQERVLGAFQRLILRNGYSVDLMGMSGADSQGRSGFVGDVNNHFWQMFGASIMTAGLAQLFQNNGNSTTVVVNGGSGSPGVTAAGQILVDVSRTINSRNTRINPTITIKQGHKFNVVVNKDIGLQPFN